MAKIVELPDGREAEFPDEMSNDAIGEVLRKQFSPQQAAPQPPTNTIGQEALRQLGLTGRALVSAAASPVMLAGNVIGKGINAVAGREIVEPYSRGLERTLNKVFPVPERPIERFTQGVAETYPAFALPGTLPAQVFGNAAIASAQAQPGEELKHAALGGGFGAAGQALGRVVGGLVKPTSEAKVLMDAGVPLTAGQQAGGVLRGAEDRLARAPLFGATIRKRQQEAIEGYQAASRQAAMPPGAAGPSNTIDEVRDAFKGAYESVLGGQSVNLTRLPTASDILEQAGKGKEAPLVARATKALDSKLKALEGLSGDGSTVDAVHLQQLESEIKQAAFRFKSSLDPNQNAYGDLLADVADLVRINWRGQLPDATRNAISAVDEAWSRFVPIRKASTKTDSTLVDPENYLPKAVLRALRDKPANKQRELATAAENVIGSRHPKPTEIGFGVASGLSGLSAGLGNLTVPPAVAAATLAYGSKPGQRFLTGQSLLNSELLARALRRGVAPATIAAGNEE